MHLSISVKKVKTYSFIYNTRARGVCGGCKKWYRLVYPFVRKNGEGRGGTCGPFAYFSYFCKFKARKEEV